MKLLQFDPFKHERIADRYLLLTQRADIVNGVVEVEPAKDEAPEAAEPAEEGKEEGKDLVLLKSSLNIMWRLGIEIDFYLHPFNVM